MIYGYVRVSSEQQRDNWSTDVQRDRIKQFADKQGEQYRIYDEVKSGKNIAERPEFQRLLEDIQKENFSSKKVWVVEQTRLTRNVSDSDYLSKLFQKHSVELYVCDALIDLRVAGSRLVYGIQSVVAAHERELTGERIKRSKKEAADKGALKNSALLGYRHKYKEDGSTCWYIDEGEAKTVRKIFQDYLDGISVNRIATDLNRLGYQTKRGKSFEAVTVAKLLNHPYYFGLTFDSEGSLIPSNVYQPILSYSRDEFLEARTLRKPKADKFKYVKKDVSGLIECKNCGAIYYVHRKKNNDIEYLYLTHQSDLGIPCGQLPKYIGLEKNAREFESFFEEAMRDLVCLSRLMLREEFERPTAKTIEEEAVRITTELENLDRKKQKLIEAVESGIFSTQDIKDRVEKINHEAERFKAIGLELTGKMRKLYDPSEVTEEESQRRIDDFKASSIEDRHRIYQKIIKSCQISGGTVTLIRFDREIFQWKA